MKEQIEEMLPSIIDVTKLVIWDLDDTFWKGTLTESGVHYSTANHDIVVALARHGIISSISSNNNYDEASEILESHGVLSYFVFPKINWGEKAAHIAEILRDAQLQPENTIFLDDKPRIRGAVLAQTPNLLAVSTAEEFAVCFEKWAARLTPSDPELTRLQRYKLLEKKAVAKSDFLETPTNTYAFLRSCDIKCTVGEVTVAEVPRIVELVQRTNQINFTQQRDSEQTLRDLLANEKFECRYIQVWDKFGDYGVAGFYALCLADRSLHHFLFSCRILGMGIEIAVHKRLKHPKILFAPDKAQTFEDMSKEYPQPDWVTFCQFATESSPKPALQHSVGSLVFIGPCELETLGYGLRFLLKGKLKHEYLVQHINKKGHLITHFGYASLLELARMPDVIQRHETTLTQLPWLDPMLFDASVFERKRSIVVLSSVRNAQCASYLHCSGEFSLPLDYFRLGCMDLSLPKNQATLEAGVRRYHSAPDFDASMFVKEFQLDGMLSRETYSVKLKEIAAKMPEDSKLVVLTVAEIPLRPFDGLEDKSRSIVERWRLQHITINEAIREATASMPEKIIPLDVNKHIKSDDDFLGQQLNKPDIRVGKVSMAINRYYHYERHIYIGLIIELLDFLVEWGMLDITNAEKIHLAELTQTLTLAPDEQEGRRTQPSDFTQ